MKSTSKRYDYLFSSVYSELLYIQHTCFTAYGIVMISGLWKKSIVKCYDSNKDKFVSSTIMNDTL